MADPSPSLLALLPYYRSTDVHASVRAVVSSGSGLLAGRFPLCARAGK